MTTLLVDANNIAIRAILAPHQEMSVDDIDTGALVLFLSMLSRYVRIERPTKGLACWDSGYSAYRAKLYPDYKANRKHKATDESKASIALMQSFLRLAGFPQLQLPGYEGDDLIYASWRACRGREHILILSSDKDLSQMIEDGTEQIKLVPNAVKPDKWDKARFIKECGFRPTYQACVLALTGDTSDNIPGLARVGPKTAIKMLKAANWNMLALINSLPAESQERVMTNLALIDLSYAPIELEAPPSLDLVGPDDEGWEELADFCDRWELKQIKAKLASDKLWTD